MNDDEIRNSIDTLLPALGIHSVAVKGDNIYYICPFCGSGTGKHKTAAFHTFTPSRGSYRGRIYYCNACGGKGDVYQLYMQIFKTDFKAAKAGIIQALGGEYSPTTIPSPAPASEQGKREYRVLTSDEVEQMQARLASCPAHLDYLHKRGLKDGTIQAAKIGVVDYVASNGQTYQNLFFPDKDGTGGTMRTISANMRLRYSNLSGCEIKANVYKMYDGAGKKRLAWQTVFVMEGIMDALTAFQCGYTAIAFRGGCYNSIDTLFKFRDKVNQYIIIPDADTAGAGHAKAIYDGLKKHADKVSIASPNPLRVKGCKDLNEYLCEFGDIITQDLLKWFIQFTI